MDKLNKEDLMKVVEKLRSQKFRCYLCAKDKNCKEFGGELTFPGIMLPLCRPCFKILSKIWQKIRNAQKMSAAKVKAWKKRNVKEVLNVRKKLS